MGFFRLFFFRKGLFLLSHGIVVRIKALRFYRCTVCLDTAVGTDFNLGSRIDRLAPSIRLFVLNVEQTPASRGLLHSLTGYGQSRMSNYYRTPLKALL